VAETDIRNYLSEQRNAAVCTTVRHQTGHWSGLEVADNIIIIGIITVEPRAEYQYYHNIVGVLTFLVGARTAIST